VTSWWPVKSQKILQYIHSTNPTPTKLSIKLSPSLLFFIKKKQKPQQTALIVCKHE
jgi:hypothetical protein